MPDAKKRAVVFWDGVGEFWIPLGGAPDERRGPFTSANALDDAITDAKAQGYIIDRVQRTRGLLPAWQPKVQGHG